jgi:NADPH2:quinone reductase
MKAIGLDEFGGPEVLHVVDLPDPLPGSGEVLIRVNAVAVNPTDATFRSGGRAALLADIPRPLIPGMDVAGTIAALGADADERFAVGDPVIAYVLPFGPRGGSYASLITIDARSVVRAPRDATPAEASTLLLNALTADLALDRLDLKAGQTVAVTGAAGAVGGFAVQLAKVRGLTVIADAQPSDRELVASLGADRLVSRDGFVADVRASAPTGVLGLIDGANRNDAIVGAIADGGILASVKGWKEPVERAIRVETISSFPSATDTERFERLRDLAEAGKLTLRVASILPAARAGEAQQRLMAGGTRGRIVLDFSSLE